MGALKFFGTIVLKFKSIVFKFKSIYSGIILFFREIKTLFSATSVEGATSAEKSIYPIVNSIRIWFLYVKDHLPEFITIITIEIYPDTITNSTISLASNHCNSTGTHHF